MAKYVFLNIPRIGRILPTLAVAEELVRRGQEVVYYLPEQFRDAVEATGAVLHGYESRLAGAESVWPSATRAGLSAGGFPAAMVDEAGEVLPQILDDIRTERPDCMVYGAMYTAASIVKRALDIPAVALRQTFAMNEQADWFSTMVQQRDADVSNMTGLLAGVNARLAELCAGYGVAPLDIQGIIAQAEPLNIVFVPKDFQLAGESFDDRYAFVGPAVLRRRHEVSDFPLDELSDDRPILYVSLGTVFNNRPDFYRTCLEAFGGRPWQVVLATGGQVDPGALGPVPDNFLVSRYVPQLDILPRTRVFVTHCGMNSAMESLYFGVPMVSVPQMAEQAITARRVAELGLGVTLEPDAVNVDTLREAVHGVAAEPEIRERVQRMQKITREAGGYQRAAEAIIRFVAERNRQGRSQR